MAMAEITRKMLEDIVASESEPGCDIISCDDCEWKTSDEEQPCSHPTSAALATLCLGALDRLEDITTPTDDGDEFSRRHYLANLLLSRVGRRENG
jgi:hypothetical protein